MVLLTAVIVIFLLRIWPLTGTIWQRIRDDWTQLSFIIYGGIVWYIVLIFDEYSHDEPWLFAAWISLALGCWLYLESREPIQRILILLCGATLAMWIVAGGKWVLTPLQTWPVNLESERWFESLSAMVSWVAIIVVLMIPVLLNLLPQRRKSIPNENPVT